MGQYIKNKQQYKKEEVDQTELVLNDQKFSSTGRKNEVSSPTQKNNKIYQQQSPYKQIAFDSLSKIQPMCSVKGDQIHNKYLSETKNKQNQHDTFEEYKKYLNTERKDCQTKNPIINNPEGKVAEKYSSLKLNQDIQKLHIEISATPTSFLQGFPDNKKTIILNAAQVPVLSSAKSVNQMSQEGSDRFQKREATYESERSSMFSENMNRDNPTNRNRLLGYSGKEEMSKKDIIEQYILNKIPLEQNPFFPSPAGVHQFLELNMRMNNVSSLQDSLFLKNLFLRTVDLRNNQLKKLPESICELNILWKLRVDYNLLEELPSGMAKLQRLELLTASSNKIKALPQGIFQLTDKLGILQVNDNQIKILPRELGDLRKLKILLLHNNRITRVPNEISSLVEITEFSIEWFQYLNPPMSKVLKDERGVLMIKDFLKFCRIVGDINIRSACSFTHFLAYFHKVQDLSELCNLKVLIKERSVLHYITLNGHLHLLKHLMKHIKGLDVNHADQDGTTPLILAFKNKQMNIIKYMMKQPIINFNKGSTKYGYPFHQAIIDHSFKLVMSLFKPKYVLNINAIDEEGCNALHYLMAHFGSNPEACTKICNYLLKKGIQVNLLNKAGLSPLHIAVKSCQNKALKYIILFNQFTRRQKSLNQNAAFVGDQCNILSLRQKQETFNFNLQGNNRWSPLHYAIFSNNLYAVEFMLYASHIECIDLFLRDAGFRRLQDLSPYNSPIYKIVVKRQQQIIQEKIRKKTKFQHVDVLEFMLENIIQLHTDLRQIKKKKSVRIEDKTQRLLRRHNSNAQISTQHSKVQQNKSVLYFGAQESSNESSQERVPSRPRFGQIVVAQESSDEEAKPKLSLKIGNLTISKTEKTLNISKELLFNNVRLQKNNEDSLDEKKKIIDTKRTQIANKQSPRMMRPLSPLQPKSIVNTEETLNQNQDDIPFITQEGEIDEQIVPELKFVSNHVNFCTVHDDSLIQESEDSSEIESSDSSDVMYKNEYFYSEYVMKWQSKEFSNPTCNKSKCSRPNSNLSKKKKRDHSSSDDFCCEAEEDTETGAIGIMANKINKFENHNYNGQEIEKKMMNQKSALKKIMQQLKDSKIQQVEQIKVLGASERYHRRQRILDSATDKQLYEQIDPSQIEPILNSYRDEGNVFDTVDHLDVLISPKMTPDLTRLNRQVSENKFMSKFNDSEKAKIPEDTLSASGNMKELNRYCKLYDTTNSSYDQERIFAVLNDPQTSFHLKYQMIYQHLYLSNGTIDDYFLKQVYQRLDDNGTNLIIKADLSYLLSVTKNKAHIPVLDKAIKKIQENNTIATQRVKSSSQLGMSTSQSKAISQTEMAGGTSPRDIVTPEGIRRMKQSATQKKLMIYESQNAYDLLMNEAMLKSKQLMEQCNQKIHQEREKSKERMKTKINNSHQTQMHNSSTSRTDYKTNNNGISLSIREIPKLVTRLNKSPSSQNIQGRKFQDQYLLNPSPKKLPDCQRKSSYKEKPVSQKQSFTPKGISGQVFLAFQKQKELNGIPSVNFFKQHTMLEQDDHYLNLNSSDNENYNETIINLRKPHQFGQMQVSSSLKTVVKQEHLSLADGEDNDSEEIFQQKTKLEIYIQKRKEELSKQQQMTKPKERHGQIFFQPVLKKTQEKPTTSNFVNISTIATSRNKTAQKQLHKSKQGLQKQANKVSEMSIDTEEKKKQLSKGTHTNKQKANEQPKVGQGVMKFGINNSRLRVQKNYQQAQINTNLIKKSTSVSKLTSDTSYLQ